MSTSFLRDNLHTYQICPCGALNVRFFFPLEVFSLEVWGLKTLISPKIPKPPMSGTKKNTFVKVSAGAH